MKYFILSLIFIFSLSLNVFASEIYFESKNQVSVGETVTLPVYLNTLGKNINTIDIEIYFNSELFDFVGYQEQVFKNWIVTPKVENNKIYFTGVVPGGVEGIYDPNKKGLLPIPIIDLSFKAKTPGNASFIFIKNEVLKNDGEGTTLEVNKKDLNIIINSNPEKVIEVKIDNNPPLAFKISLLEDEETGKILIFHTTDLESGVAFYKIKNNFKWDSIISPHKIDKPFFDEVITIRAYDFNNNFTESYLAIDGYFNKYVFYFLLLIFASILVRKLIK